MKCVKILCLLWLATGAATPAAAAGTPAATGTPAAAGAAPATAGLKGELIQGGFVVGNAAGAQKVFLDGISLPLTADGQFILGFGRDHKSKALLKLHINNSTEEIELTIKKRTYAIQAIDGVEEEKVTPPPSAWARIKKETIQKRAARQQIQTLLGWQENFIWPAEGLITGIYGSQRILNSIPKRPHYGIDIAAPPNSPVVAPASGRVTLAGDDFYFEGGLIFLDHGFGLSSAFLHLGKVLVRVGQQVKRGERIALSGNSGRSTGAHLDWRVKWHKQNLDPALIVKSSNVCALGFYVRHSSPTCHESKASSLAVPESSPPNNK